MNSERLFFFAGLYSAKLECFVIITTAANSFVRAIHNRMPLILSPDDYGLWLDPQSRNYKAVTPTPEEMKTYWVSDRMNSSRVADPEAAQPLAGTVKSVFGGYPLPAGLPEGATVKIRSFDHGYHQVEFKGHVFQVFAGGVSFKSRNRNVALTLHSYRYAWAERAKIAGMPERFAQEPLGYNSKAVHRAHARKAQMKIPCLEEYGKKERRELHAPMRLVME
jgi:hypothetical protein